MKEISGWAVLLWIWLFINCVFYLSNLIMSGFEYDFYTDNYNTSETFGGKLYTIVFFARMFALGPALIIVTAFALKKHVFTRILLPAFFILSVVIDWFDFLSMNWETWFVIGKFSSIYFWPTLLKSMLYLFVIYAFLNYKAFKDVYHTKT